MELTRFERFRWLLKRAGISLYEDGCLGTAKGAAYSGLLSFFPIITTTALILVRAKAEEIAGVISRFLFEAVPPGAKELVMRRFTLAAERPVSLVVFAVAVSLWASSGLFLSLIEGFNAVYKLPSNRPMVSGRFVAFGLAFCCALPALGASALILSGNRTEIWLVTTLGVLEQGEDLVGWVFVVSKLLRFAIALAASILTLLILYKLAPYRPQKWNYIWPGSLIAAVLWFVVTLGFSWYVRDIADYNFFFGSIGAVVALLLWMYLLSLIMLYGCAFNAEYERLEAASVGLKP